MWITTPSGVEKKCFRDIVDGYNKFMRGCSRWFFSNVPSVPKLSSFPQLVTHYNSQWLKEYVRIEIFAPAYAAYSHRCMHVQLL
jgi:hypothetical protein